MPYEPDLDWVNDAPPGFTAERMNKIQLGIAQASLDAAAAQEVAAEAVTEAAAAQAAAEELAQLGDIAPLAAAAEASREAADLASGAAADARDAAMTAAAAAQAVGDTSDAIMAGVAADPDSAFTGALVTPGNPVFDSLTATSVQVAGVAQGVVYPAGAAFGAVTFTALQDACDEAAATGQRVWASGSITTSETLVIQSDAELGGLTINFTGDDVAVQVGSTSGVTHRRRIVCPRVACGSKPTTGWTAGTVGVQLVNLASGPELMVPFVAGFETGVLMYGQGQGCVYNTVSLGHLYNNKRNLGFDANASGWTNQNTILGGRLSHDPAEGAAVAGTAHVWFGNPANRPNNNTFLGTSFESAGTVQYMLDMESGIYNQFINCRWEATSGTASVRWGANATLNDIFGGYAAGSVVETKVAGQSRNIVHSSVRSKVFTGAGTGVVAENTSSASAPIWTLMPAGADAAGSDPATAYLMRIAPDSIRFKATADAHERMRVDAPTGRCYFGNGGTTPAVYLWGANNTMFVKATTLGFDTDNTTDIGAAAAYRPRYVRAGTAVVTASVATGSRPSAATAGAGAMVFDSTLGKPIWSTGSAWVDATGATA